MSTGKIIPYGKQDVTAGDIEIVSKVLSEDYITTGPRVKEFEEAFADYLGVNHAVALANGTAALHLCAMAMNIRPGDQVITTPITFSASANCVLYCGGEVIMCDIDPESFLISLDAITEKLEEDSEHKIKGIIPVDLAGLPVDMEALRKLADDHNLWIIEDSCHAPGAWFNDSSSQRQMCGNGNFADLAIFSFHPVKHITTGEGGMVTTNDTDLAEHIKKLRNHGITRDPNQIDDYHGGWFYQLKELGYNYRLTDFQAALGHNQLKRIDTNLQRRLALADNYDQAFENSNVQTPTRIKDGQHAFHLYIIRVEDRKGLYDHLRDHHIYAQVHYIPLHYLEYYQNLGYQKGDFPNAEKYYDTCLSLPMYPTLSEQEQDFVIEKVLEFIS